MRWIYHETTWTWNAGFASPRDMSDGSTVDAISNAIDSIVVGVNCDNNKILVVTDNYYDAWKVYVDGKPGKLLRADGSFKAVAVTAGTLIVIFGGIPIIGYFRKPGDRTPVEQS